MKMLIPLSLFALMIVFTSCREEILPNPPDKTEYMNTITITGYDMRLCACCGGYIANFRGDKNLNNMPGGDNFLLANSDEELGLTNKDIRLPLTLNVDWRKEGDCASENRIKVTKVYQ